MVHRGPCCPSCLSMFSSHLIGSNRSQSFDSAVSRSSTLQSNHSRVLCVSARFFSLSQPLLSPRRSDLQGQFRIVAVIIILIPSLRSLRLCEIPFPQSVRSLAKTLRSPRAIPYSRSHHHSHPLFALFASLRDSFPSVSSFSRQDAEVAKGISV